VKAQEGRPPSNRGPRGGRAAEANDTAIVASPVTEIKNRLRRLDILEQRLLDEQCGCELGVCASCVALSAIRKERRQLQVASR